ncbi:MAG: hypothetical protein AB1422_14890, partial [bacterium]
NNHEISQDGGNPIWSPRGDLIAFVCKGWIYTMKPDGSERRKVIDGNYIGDWIPDGKAFTASISGGTHIVDLNGNVVKYTGLCGQWSPDGKMILCGFDVYDSIDGKKIGEPLSVGIPKSTSKYFVYKRPNNIW